MSSVLDSNYIFVVGAPRSGTTWLAAMLSSHADVASLPAQELTLFSRYLAPAIAQYRKEKHDIDSGKWEQGLPLVMNRDDFRKWLEQLLDQSYSSVLSHSPNATFILDKHPNYAQYLDLIAEYLPNARFVHIIRDGREVAVSMMSVRKRVGHSPGEVNEAAALWRRFVEKATSSDVAGTNKYMEVRYEDLRLETEDELKQIASHIGLSVNDNWILETAEKFSMERKQLSAGNPDVAALRNEKDGIWKGGLSRWERYRFNEIAGPLLISLGYAQKDWWVLSSMDRFHVTGRIARIRLKRGLKALYQAMFGTIDYTG